MGLPCRAGDGHPDTSKKKRAMEEKNVLCVDPCADSLQNLGQMLQSSNFVPHLATRMGEAFEMAAVHRPGVIVLEQQAAAAPQPELLRMLHRVHPQSPVVMLTTQHPSSEDAERRLSQVFEFVEKPIHPGNFVDTVQRAWSFHTEKQTLYNEYENEERMKYQMEWLLWKGRSHMHHRVEFTRQIVESIRHSLSQGMGMGSLVTLGQMLEMDRRPDGDRYSVSKKTVDALIASTGLVDSWLVFLTELAGSLEGQFRAELMSGDSVNAAIAKAVLDVEPYRVIKGHRLEWDSSDLSHTILAKREVIELAIRELVLNAFKYSPDGTTVSILKYRQGNHQVLAVVNDIQPMAGGITGIPPEIENQVFEPFFRANHQFDERFGLGTSGLGVGLTLVQKAVFEVGGKIFVHEVTDYSALHGNRRVMAEILFPVGRLDSQSARTDRTSA